MYTSLFDPKNKITLVKTLTNNLLHVKVTGPNNLDFDIHYLSKSEYELALYMRSLSKILKPTEITKLLNLIDEFGDQRYKEASDNAAMEAAENDV